MKFQTLKKDNRKYWVIGIIVVLIIAVVLCFVGTRAKYKQTQSIQVATGTINYIKDIEPPAISKVESSKTTTSITLTVTATDNIGVTKYYYSKDGGSTYTDSTESSHTFSGLTAGGYSISIYVIDAVGNESTKYTTIISTVTAKDTILADNGGASVIEAKTAPDFSQISPQIASYTDNNFTNSESSYSIITSRYVTYADSYTFDESTGKYSLVNAQVGVYSAIYNDLPGKYIVSYSGSSSSSAATSTNLSIIYKITSSTTSSRIYYISSSKTEHYDLTDGGMYAAEDDDGTTYYFRGSVDNNWVQFGTDSSGNNLYWRIIRINGDGTIRLIYNGTSAGATGSSARIGTSAFNVSFGDNTYVGYMNGTAGSTEYAATHTNTNDSTIKSAIDTWYSSNLASYESYLDGNAGWCGDRTSNTSEDGASTQGTSGGYGTTQTYYGAYYRRSKGTPSFKCSQSNDLYTVSGSTNGNKALTYPIGLITADEVMYAGGKNADNYGYWLNTGSSYWTMSPSWFQSTYLNAYVFLVTAAGELHHYRYYVDSVFGVRPVINLKADIQFTGSGTTTDVYKVVGAS